MIRLVSLALLLTLSGCVIHHKRPYVNTPWGVVYVCDECDAQECAE